jgi:hypothetical protein
MSVKGICQQAKIRKNERPEEIDENDKIDDTEET